MMAIMNSVCNNTSLFIFVTKVQESYVQNNCF